MSERTPIGITKGYETAGRKSSMSVEGGLLDRLSAELSRIGDELSGLKWASSITDAVRPHQPREEVINSVLQVTVKALGANAVVLYSASSEDGRPVCAGAHGIAVAAVQPQSEEQETVLSALIGLEEPLVIEDTQAMSEPCLFQLPLLDISVRSVLCLQLRSGDTPVGLLVALYRKPGGALTRPLEACRLLADRVAALLNYSFVLENARNVIRDLQESNARLSKQAAQDGLTGLSNHRSFHQRMTEQVHRVGRYGETFSLAMIDVDHFKAYNDAFGHQEGDLALQRIARIIAEQLRESDIPARYGGEEFAIILPHTPKPQARVALERIRKAIDTFAFPSGKLTVSTGIAECPCDGVTASEIVEKADRTLYHAKLTGRNRVCLWASPSAEVAAGESSGADIRAVSVLVVENDLDARQLVERCLSGAGYDMHRAASTEEAVALLRTRKFDIMLSDTLVLGAEGMEILGLASAIHPTMPIVLTTGPSMVGAAREAMRHGATDLLIRPFSEHELPIVIERNLERKRIERQMLLEKSTGILLQAIDALVAAIDAKDKMTAGHTTRVTHISLAIADTLGLPSEERYTLELSARLHDIGKISLPDSALNNSGSLSGEEWNAMRRHPAVGSQIVGAIGDLSYVATIVRHHHERLDGRGYPDGLQGEAIPLLARIIAVADAFEAMTSERSFRRRMTPSAALAELRTCVGTHYSAEIVEALVASLDSGAIDEERKEAA